MAPKRKDVKISRRWTEEELDIFAEILADTDNGFAAALERLALKKSANNEVFEHIQRLFNAELDSEEFLERNGNLSKLDTSVNKLRIKYKWLKQEWAAKTRRAKNGYGLEPDQEPQWYKVLNPVFAETHRPLNLVSSAMDTSFLNNPALSDDSMNEDDLENSDTENSTDTGNEPARKKTKIVVAPHKKHQQIRSNKQGLSAIARGLNAAIVAQDKRFDRQFKANDEREKRLLEFRVKEAEKEREHEYRMAQLFATMKTQSALPYPQFPNYPQPSQQYPGGWDTTSGIIATPNKNQSNSTPLRARDPFQPPSSNSDNSYSY